GGRPLWSDTSPYVANELVAGRKAFARGGPGVRTVAGAEDRMRHTPGACAPRLNALQSLGGFIPLPVSGAIPLKRLADRPEYPLHHLIETSGLGEHACHRMPHVTPAREELLLGDVAADADGAYDVPRRIVHRHFRNRSPMRTTRLALRRFEDDKLFPLDYRRAALDDDGILLRHFLGELGRRKNVENAFAHDFVAHGAPLVQPCPVGELEASGRV